MRITTLQPAVLRVTLSIPVARLAHMPVRTFNPCNNQDYDDVPTTGGAHRALDKI